MTTVAAPHFQHPQFRLSLAKAQAWVAEFGGAAQATPRESAPSLKSTTDRALEQGRPIFAGSSSIESGDEPATSCASPRVSTSARCPVG